MVQFAAGQCMVIGYLCYAFDLCKITKFWSSIHTTDELQKSKILIPSCNDFCKINKLTLIFVKKLNF